MLRMVTYVESIHCDSETQVKVLFFEWSEADSLGDEEADGCHNRSDYQYNNVPRQSQQR